MEVVDWGGFTVNLFNRPPPHGQLMLDNDFNCPFVARMYFGCSAG